jgi:ribonuclease E
VPVAVEPDADDAEAAPKRSRRRPRARAADEVQSPAPVVDVVAETEPDVPAKPKRSRKKADPIAEAAAPVAELVAVEPAAKPKRSRKKAEPAPAAANDADTVGPAPDGDGAAPADDAAGADEDGQPRRGGWWKRTFGE